MLSLTSELKRYEDLFEAVEKRLFRQIRESFRKHPEEIQKHLRGLKLEEFDNFGEKL